MLQTVSSPGLPGCWCLPALERSLSIGNFKGRMGSVEAKAYLASPEVVASSALSGMISGPGWYQQPEGISDVVMGEGDGIKEDERMITTEEAIEKIIDQLDHVIKTAESKTDIASESKITQGIEVLPNFPSKVEGELLFCDADNINVSCHFLLSTFLIP